MGFYGNTTYEIVETIPEVKIDGKVISPDKGVEIIGEELIKVEMNDEQKISIKHELRQSDIQMVENGQYTIGIVYQNKEVGTLTPDYNCKMGGYLIFSIPHLDQYGHVLSGDGTTLSLQFPTLTWETW